MSAPVTVGETESLETVAAAMLRNRVTGVVVTDPGGRAVGIITEDDFTNRAVMPSTQGHSLTPFAQAYRSYSMGTPVGDLAAAEARLFMHALTLAVTEDDALEDVVSIMAHSGIAHLPVLRDDRPVGMFSHDDLVQLAGLLQTLALPEDADVATR